MATGRERFGPGGTRENSGRKKMETLGNIIWYDALAPHPEVLL